MFPPTFIYGIHQSLLIYPIHPAREPSVSPFDNNTVQYCCKVLKHTDWRWRLYDEILVLILISLFIYYYDGNNSRQSVDMSNDYVCTLMTCQCDIATCRFFCNTKLKIIKLQNCQMAKRVIRVPGY